MYAVNNLNNTFANSGLAITGVCGYNIINNWITLNVGEIISERNVGSVSGTLSLELWAMKSPYQGGGFTGYALAGTRLGQLNGQNYFAPASYVLDYQTPPEGSWYVVLMLREWNGGAYETCAYINFAVPLEVGSGALNDGNLINVSFTEQRKSSTVDAQTGQLVVNEYSVMSSAAKPAAGGLVLMGNCGYVEQNGEITINVGEIANQRDGGNISGTLALELWALNSPFTGGDFDGFALAGASIGTLSGQHALYNASYEMAYREPPEGEWYLALMLREWNGVSYETRDCINFAVPYNNQGKAPVQSKPAGNVINVSFAGHKKIAAAETESSKPITSQVSAQPSINQATMVDLTTIKGMPKKTAENIVAEQPYSSFDALSEVKGVGPKLMKMLRELFTL